MWAIFSSKDLLDEEGGHKGSLTSGLERRPLRCIRNLMGTGLGSQKISLKKV